MAGAWRLVGYPVVRNFVHDVVLNIAEGVLNGLHGLQAAVGARYAGSCGQVAGRLCSGLRRHVMQHGDGSGSVGQLQALQLAHAIAGAAPYASPAAEGGLLHGSPRGQVAFPRCMMLQEKLLQISAGYCLGEGGEVGEVEPAHALKLAEVGAGEGPPKDLRQVAQAGRVAAQIHGDVAQGGAHGLAAARVLVGVRKGGGAVGVPRVPLGVQGGGG